jgi:hypothetical protein
VRPPLTCAPPLVEPSSTRIVGASSKDDDAVLLNRSYMRVFRYAFLPTGPASCMRS